VEVPLVVEALGNCPVCPHLNPAWAGSERCILWGPDPPQARGQFVSRGGVVPASIMNCNSKNPGYAPAFRKEENNEQAQSIMAGSLATTLECREA